MESQKTRQPDQKERKRDVMYNPKSLKAEEFISDEEIRETLAYADANKDNVELIDQILAKAKECKGLTHREASVLLACEMPDKIQEMYDLAAEIKKEFYGNRIVLFAPLYLSNYCINGCVYCPYHKKNTHIARKKLTQEEIVKEVTALQDMGHKRLAIEAGEDPENNPIEYILESIKTIYSIKHKNGAIRRVNVNIAATTVENYRKLKEAGIEVVSGVLEAECNEINRVFRHYITTKQPYVVMKTAMTLDGKIATATGESQWISGEASRKDVHRLRHKYTGIMVGINTIIHDNARLTCRMEQGKNPVRIVVDSCLRIALTSNVLKDQENNQTILATTNQASPLAARKLETFGSKVLYCSSKDNRVDLNDLMNQLGAMGVDSILLEGGATLNDAALRAGIVQEVVTYIAPKMIGGAVAPTPVGGIGVEHLQDAYQLGQMKVSAIGDDIKISAYIQPKTKIQPTEAN